MNTDKYMKLKGKKVIVTGGAGFIGSHLCEELVKLGANVLSVDNFSSGKEKNIEFLKGYPNFKSLNIDITNKEALDEIMPGVDIIFNNAASKKNICLINPQRDLEVNAGGTLNLLELSMKHGVKKFIHASTGSVYGEPYIFPTTETHPYNPVSYYGVSKLAGERYVNTFHHLYNLDTTILRYFHVYGPRQESNEFGGVVSIFLRNILEKKDVNVFGHGEQMRSFTWVKDLVEANLASVVNPVSKGQVYNTASGIKVTINELAYNMIEMMGAQETTKVRHGEPLVGDIMKFDVSNEKIKSELGIEFEQDFWGTLKRTLSEFTNYLNEFKS